MWKDFIIDENVDDPDDIVIDGDIDCGIRDDSAASTNDVDAGYVVCCINNVASGENTGEDNGEDVNAGSNSRG